MPREEDEMGENEGAAHKVSAGVGLADLQAILMEQMRELQRVDPRDAEAVEGACAVAEAVRGLAGVAVDNANTALRAKALVRDLRMSGMDTKAAESKLLEA